MAKTNDGAAVAKKGKTVAELSAELSSLVAPAKTAAPASAAGREYSSRSTWKGSITFGLMSFNAKILTGQKAARVELNMIHDTCHSRLNQTMLCSSCKDEHDNPVVVPYENRLKGAPKPDGSYIALSKDEIEECLIESTQDLEIESFVSANEIDTILVQSTDHLVPDSSGKKGNLVSDKLYFLLLNTMKKSGTVAIAKFAQRGSESVIAIRPTSDGTQLVVNYLYFNNEVRMVNLPTAPVLTAAEEEVAGQLVAMMKGTFDITAYTDRKLNALEALVATKMAGTTPSKKMAKAAKAAPAGDILDALKASIAAAEVVKKARKSA